MKYIYAGYCKTGTKTMASVFKTLGYNVYDIEESLLFHYNEWQKILDPYNKLSTKEKKQILEKMYKSQDVDVITDLPGLFYWYELMEIFPEAKVIFSEREEDSWWESFSKQHKQSGDMAYTFPDFLAKPLRRIFSPTWYKINQMMEYCCTRYTAHKGFGVSSTFGRMDLDEMSCRSLYRSHNANVLRNCQGCRVILIFA